MFAGLWHHCARRYITWKHPQILVPLHQPEHFSLSQVQGSAAQALLRGRYLLTIFTGLSRMLDAPRPARPKIWRRSLRRPAAHDSCAPLSTLQRLPNLPEEFAWLREQHRIERRAVRRPTAEVRADAADAYSRMKAAVGKVSLIKRRRRKQPQRQGFPTAAPQILLL